MKTGSFDRFLDSAFKGKTPAEIAASPADALNGVTEADTVHLKTAFGIETVGELAQNRFFTRAASIWLESHGVDHDRGPDVEWTSLFASAPLATYQANPNDFRVDFGPIYYRGRLDGTARVLIVGQDPAANELVGHRAFVGTSGQRLQGFLRRLGIRRDYVMVNTFLYPVFGQFVGKLRDLTKDPQILGFRNSVLDKIATDNELEAVIAVGAAARDAIERWPGLGDLFQQHVTHPSAKDHIALLTNWNDGLAALRPVVSAETGVEVDGSNYGSSFKPEDVEPIPRRDLPFGVPAFHGVGSHAVRARTDDNKTDHKRIIWKAP